MRTRLFFFMLLFASFSKPAFSQETDCTVAVQQLQDYAAQVNKIYYDEYWNYIPNQRCPPYWNGQLVNPQFVQNCRLQTLSYLNQWYIQQCNYVNSCYYKIVAYCGGGDTSKKPGHKPKTGTIENKPIDTNEIESLTAGIDENKTVKIRIPETAAAFQSEE